MPHHPCPPWPLASSLGARRFAPSPIQDKTSSDLKAVRLLTVGDAAKQVAGRAGHEGTGRGHQGGRGKRPPAKNPGRRRPGPATSWKAGGRPGWRKDQGGRRRRPGAKLKAGAKGKAGAKTDAPPIDKAKDDVKKIAGRRVSPPSPAS